MRILDRAWCTLAQRNLIQIENSPLTLFGYRFVY